MFVGLFCLCIGLYWVYIAPLSVQAALVNVHGALLGAAICWQLQEQGISYRDVLIQCVVSVCRSLLRICRALLRVYRALLRVYRALLSVCISFVIVRLF